MKVGTAAVRVGDGETGEVSVVAWKVGMAVVVSVGA